MQYLVKINKEAIKFKKICVKFFFKDKFMLVLSKRIDNINTKDFKLTNNKLRIEK